MDSKPSSVRKRIVHGTAWALVVRLLSGGLGLALYGLIARLMSPEEVGGYFLGLSLATVGATLGQFGLPQTLTRRVAASLATGDEAEARAVVGTAFAFALIPVSLVALALSAIVVPVVADELVGSSHLGTLALLVGIWAAALAFQSLISDAFRGFHKLALAALTGGLVNGLVAVGVSVTVLGILWAHSGEARVAMVVGVVVAGLVLNVAIMGSILVRHVKTSGCTADQGAILQGLIVDAWPLAINATALYLGTNAALWVVAIYLDEAQVALYGVAFRLVVLTSLPAKVVGGAVSSTIADLHSRGETKRLERMVATIACAVGVPAIAGLILLTAFGREVLELVYGSTYIAAYPILAALLIGEIIRTLLGPAMLALIMTGHGRDVANVTTGTLLSVVLAAIAVVEPWGLLGVAIVNAAGMAVQGIAFWMLARRRCGFSTHVRPMYVAKLNRTDRTS